jgi:endonuclease/exonuclease/phosphatase family metal-dependent hydrolase
VIVRQLHELSGYDIVGLTEVRASSIKKYVDALSASGNTFLGVNTATGRSDRFVLAYNTKRLQILSGYEMHRYGDWLLNSQGNDGIWRHRSPLVGHFRDRESGVEFIVTVNHLARGNENIRRRQAGGLRKWAEAQSLPLIAIGDYNFDYDFHTKTGNMAFQLFTKDNVWKWVRPEKLIDSNWADNNPRLPLDQRTDRYPDSILDFIFVAGPAKDWQAKSWVVVRQGDFPDSDETSDHRPVAAVVGLLSGQ